MFYKKLKKFCYVVLGGLFFSIATIYLLIIITLIILPSYQKNIANYITTKTNTPITFSNLKFSWRGVKFQAKVDNLVLDDKIAVDSAVIVIHPLKSLINLNLYIERFILDGGEIAYKIPDYNSDFKLDINNINLKNYLDYIFKTYDQKLSTARIDLRNSEIKDIEINLNNKQKIILNSLTVSKTRNYFYIKSIVNTALDEQVGDQDLEEADKVELSLKYDRTHTIDHKFYFYTNSSPLFDYLFSFAKTRAKNKIDLKSLSFDPKTEVKIWGGIQKDNYTGFDLASGIQLVVASPKLELQYNDNNLLFEKISGKLTYSSMDYNKFDKFKLQVENLAISFAGSDFKIDGELLNASHIDNQIDAQNIKINFGNTEAKSFLAQVPSEIISQTTKNWLNQHLRSGRIGKAEIAWDNKNIFSLQADLLNINLDYHAHWPKLENMDASLTIYGQELNIVSTKANIGNNKIGKIRATIPELANTENTYLKLDGTIHTSGVELPVLIASTPLVHKLDDVNKIIKFDGTMDLLLNLKIPLVSHNNKIQQEIAGRLEFKNNNLIVENTPFSFTNLNGAMAFTDTAVSSENLSAHLNNNIAKFKLDYNGRDKKGFNLFLNGRIDSSFLLNYFALDLNKYITGVTDFNLALNNNKKKLNIEIDSDLSGLAVNLPKIYFNNLFNKSEKDLLRTKVAIIKNSYDAFRYNVTFINNTISSFSYISDPKASAIAINTPDIIGNINFLQNKSKQNKIYADFKKLAIYTDDTASEDKFNLENVDYFNLPELVLNVNNLSYNDLLLGKLSLNTLVDSKDKIFTILNTNLEGNIFDLRLNGSYSLYQEQKVSNINGRYKIKNLAKTISLFEQSTFSEKIKFNGSYNLTWPSDFLDFDFKKAHGDLHIDSGYGKIADIELGIGRLFGFFNIMSLNKRLRFDFSDVFESGFKFDHIGGNFKLQDGILTTEKAKIAAGSADVELYGDLDIVNKKYNIKADITPHVTSGLPVAAAVVGTPVAGAVVFLVDKLFDSPVNQMSERAYSITGPWNNPEIKKLKNKRGPLIELSWLKNEASSED